jgi:hypothetical protein
VRWQFCGVRPWKHASFSPGLESPRRSGVAGCRSVTQRRRRWLARVRSLGVRLNTVRCVIAQAAARYAPELPILTNTLLSVMGRCGFRGASGWHHACSNRKQPRSFSTLPNGKHPIPTDGRRLASRLALYAAAVRPTAAWSDGIRRAASTCRSIPSISTGVHHGQVEQEGRHVGQFADRQEQA